MTRFESLAGLVKLKERLYNLLPALYRVRDSADAGSEPLRALLGVMESELNLVEDDVAHLYQNWFIETCDEWVVPYLGDLLGVAPFHGVSQRAFIANSLAYRRRKGTLQSLESLAYDATFWPARAVEFARLVATAQHLKLPRPESVAMAELRDAQKLTALGTAFDRTAHLVDVRASGRYQRSQLGLFVWRAVPYLIERAPAQAMDAAQGFFHMSPAGHDLPLWSPGDDVGAAANAHGVPMPAEINRRALYEDLEARRQALVDGEPDFQGVFFATRPLLRIFYAAADGAVKEVPPAQILIADLEPFWTPPSQKIYRRKSDQELVPLPIAVALDPERGRISFAAAAIPARVWMSYYEAQAAELGGGGYDRGSELASSISDAGVRIITDDGSALSEQLAAQVALGHRQLVIELDATARRSVEAVRVPAGVSLELRSRNFCRAIVQGTDDAQPIVIQLEDASTLTLDGLLVRGRIAVERAAPSDAAAARSAATLRLRHCTLVPGGSRLMDAAPQYPGAASLALTAASNGALKLSMCKSITGPLILPGSLVAISDSIIDCAGAGRGASDALALKAQHGQLQRVTVLGKSALDSLSATCDVLFEGAVTAPNGESGGVSYSYLPSGSSVPLPVSCQPELAIAEAVAAGADATVAAARIRPWFTSRRYGTSGYGLLSPRCDAALRSGGSDEGELGAMHQLHCSQRAACLSSSLTDHLRFGLNLRVIYVS